MKNTELTTVNVEGELFVSKADYDKLAAECAALKESAADIRRQAINGRRNSHNCGPFQYSDLCESIIDVTKVETPAADTAVADLKAQGVDEFKVWNDAHIEAGDEHEEPLREVSKACSMFAAKLRAGVNNA